jgi:hypothetical protein
LVAKGGMTQAVEQMDEVDWFCRSL